MGKEEPSRVLGLIFFSRFHDDGAFSIGTHFLLSVILLLFTVFTILYAVQKQSLRGAALSLQENLFHSVSSLDR